MTTYTWPVVAPTPSTPSTSPSFVSGSGVPRRAAEIQQLVPDIYDSKRGGYLATLLHAIGMEDHRVLVGDRSLVITNSNVPEAAVRYVARIDDPRLRVKHLYSTAHPVTESVSVSDFDITVTLGTNAGGGIISTPVTIKAAVEATPAAHALVAVQFLGSGNKTVRRTAEYEPLLPDGLAGARQDMLLRTARGAELKVLGQNVGVERPARFPLTEEQFRQYIVALSWQRKLTRTAIENLVTVLFGTKAAVGWDVYELGNKTIVLELPDNVERSSVEGSTYLRSPSTETSTAEVTGDYLRATRLQDAFGPVKPTPASPLSVVYNNSVYISASLANNPTLLAIFTIVRAAGVKLVIKRRSE